MRKNYNTIYAMGKRVGGVRDGVFHKTIKEKWYLKYPVKSIAFDIQSLRDAEAAGAQSVSVRDTETGVTYKASIAHIWAAGTKFDRGWGKQIRLALSGFTKQGRALQLPMFGGVN